MKFPQRLCFAFCVGSCAEGVRFSASRKNPDLLENSEISQSERQDGPAITLQATQRERRAVL